MSESLGTQEQALIQKLEKVTQELALYSQKLESYGKVHAQEPPEVRRALLKRWQMEKKDLEQNKYHIHEELWTLRHRVLKEKLDAKRKQCDHLKYQEIPQMRVRLENMEDERKKLELEVLTLSNRLTKLSYERP